MCPHTQLLQDLNPRLLQEPHLLLQRGRILHQHLPVLQVQWEEAEVLLAEEDLQVGEDDKIFSTNTTYVSNHAT